MPNRRMTVSIRPIMRHRLPLTIPLPSRWHDQTSTAPSQMQVSIPVPTDELPDGMHSQSSDLDCFGQPELQQ